MSCFFLYRNLLTLKKIQNLLAFFSFHAEEPSDYQRYVFLSSIYKFMWLNWLNIYIFSSSNAAFFWLIETIKKEQKLIQSEEHGCCEYFQKWIHSICIRLGGFLVNAISIFFHDNKNYYYLLLHKDMIYFLNASIKIESRIS